MPVRGAGCVSEDTPPRSASSHRHTLLQQRGSPIAAIDMDLNMVRSELQAFYETGRLQPSHGAAPTPQIA